MSKGPTAYLTLSMPGGLASPKVSESQTGPTIALSLFLLFPADSTMDQTGKNKASTIHKYQVKAAWKEETPNVILTHHLRGKARLPEEERKLSECK